MLLSMRLAKPLALSAAVARLLARVIDGQTLPKVRNWIRVLDLGIRDGLAVRPVCSFLSLSHKCWLRCS
jgi:hypothetical protein